MTGKCPFSSRRGFLAAAGGLMAAAPVTALRAQTATQKGITPAAQGPGRGLTEPFYAPRQGGIVTALQSHTFFATFDLAADRSDQIVTMLKAWTEAAARMTQGLPAQPMDAYGQGEDKPAGDSGEAIGLAPARLTITFGFGPGLFVKNGKDRYGLAGHRPEAFVDLPAFTGEQLVAAQTGGDLSVQACADDPQVAFHAIRQLARIAYGTADLKWTQTGFMSNYAAEDTPRNLMGFKDGTQNPTATRPEATSGGSPRAGLNEVVWVTDKGPAWMHGGSYMVARRIRIALEHWDRTEISFQEEVIGRHKYSGAPLGMKNEFDPLDLDRTDKDGNSIIPDTAHVRLGAPESNGGAQILRRAYSYNDGSNFTAERWPPWRQGIEFDAGLLFICYQRDPRAGFIRIFDQMSKLDAMNQYTTHVGSGIFACPPGPAQGGYIGQKLFEAV
ncbi:Dyp-type peroxidase [Rhodopila sp.]|uniref:Dyp-type peroxidase n=1 Tax=Rhodopila sp. TaxID=2480087 RepID=UPI003D12AB58